MQPNEKMNKCENKIMFNFTPPRCEGRVNSKISLFATLNGGAHFRWVPSFLFIMVLVGALLSGAVLMAKPDTKTSNSPLALSKAFFTNADTMRHYQALLESEDPRAQYVMACSYYYASERPVPEGVPYIKDKQEADALLLMSAISGYEPAKELLRCLNTGCKPERK